MPFERYLHPSHERDTHEARHARHSADYQDYVLRTEPLGHLDSSMFSSNIQFQMPQLMLGPTVAPGGGAEVLPAGIVGHSSAVASAWLSTPNLSRYGEEYALPSYDAHPVSQHMALPPYYSPQEQPAHGQRSLPSSRNSSVAAASVSTPPSSLPATSSPIASDYNFSMSSQFPSASSSSIPLPLSLSMHSVSGLPIYSASGFDLLSILTRVTTRPNPKIALGPVDMTCSFAIVDTRRYDHPIVYASPTFYNLTGYSEEEVIGRNCRFLQAPDGQVQKGEPRRHTAPEAVMHLRKSLAADKECQISLINYRKNGSAFINLVTVIPIFGGVYNTPEEADEVVFHVGFQVDLTEQPNAILQRLRDGTYMVNYSNNVAYPAPSASRDWKINSSIVGTSKQFRALLNDQDFVQSIPLSISTTTLSLVSPDRNDKTDPYDGNKLISLLLLECSPDFLVVLSLKGAFLYVAPSVRRVLGYEPEELAGKAITDYCHTADIVPLMRELKESSTTALLVSDGGASNGAPKIVDLLFRMQAKSGEYEWIECRGRLHVEPGKGRKAIILSGRVRSMPSLQWGPIAHSGGLRPSFTCPPSAASMSAPSAKEQEQEFWALLSNTGSFLFASAAVRDVLGWGAGEVMGRALGDFISDPAARVVAEETLACAFADAKMESRNLSFQLKRKEGSLVLVNVVFYHPAGVDSTLGQSFQSQRPPLVCQIKVHDDTASPGEIRSISHAPADEVFEELDIGRESSWQYELQQLKYANQRLLEEIDELELELDQAERPFALEHDTPHLGRSYDSSWNNNLLAMGRQPHLSLKRSWDGTVIGDGGETT